MPTLSRPIRLILLPGLAADARLFHFQTKHFPSLIIPTWIPALPRESLPHYAHRLAATLPPAKRTIIGGASFGGLIALEMARPLHAEACILISSVRTPREFPPSFRALRPLSHFSEPMLKHAAHLLPTLSPATLPKRATTELRRLSHPDAAFRRWGTRAALRWSPTYDPALPIFHIHGSRDQTFPLRYTHPTTTIPNAGHLLPLTHPTELNTFLSQILQKQNP